MIWQIKTAAVRGSASTLRESSHMIRNVGKSLKSLWRPLVATDLVFKSVAFVLLTPLIGLLFRGFLSLSGRTVLADADIARFLLHPTGWLSVIVVGGAIVCLLALEQSVLMTLSLAASHGKRLAVPESFYFVAKHVTGVFQVAARMVGWALAVAVPFLAFGGCLYLLLLSEHDINYYLTEKPPRFWMAVAFIGSVLVALAVLLVRCVVNWSVAVQLHLYESIPPGNCLKTSRERVYGHRKTITKWIIIWLIAYTFISSVGTASVVWLGRYLVPSAAGRLWTLVITLGVVLAVWAVINLGTSLLAVISFALIQAEIYDRFVRTESCVIPSDDSARPSWSLKFTRTRVISCLIVALLMAGLIGVTFIHSVRLEDDVQITAHRGASGKAPENTLAAVRQAIEDGADWVEIDVQESKDGVVIVAHDSDLMKVSGVNTKIWEGTAEELRAIDIGSYFGPEFKEERVPTLAEVLDECRGNVRLNIELKYYGHDQNLEKKVVELVEKYGMESDVVIMSLEFEGIQKVKALRPEWTVGLLTAVKIGDLTRIDADFLAVNTKLATRPFIRSAHKKDKQVYVWTANDAITMSTMISHGADNLITDHPELARQVLKDRAEMSTAERVLVEFAFLFGAVKKKDDKQ